MERKPRDGGAGLPLAGDPPSSYLATCGCVDTGVKEAPMADTTLTGSGLRGQNSPMATQESLLHVRCYSAGQVANYILDLADRDGVAVTPMKLQKLVYIAYGWAMALYDLQLFREQIQAWKHGPVIPSLFHEFKVYTNNPITGRSFELNRDGSTWISSIPRLDREARGAVSGTWRAYGHLTAANLRSRTHAPDAPWSQVYDGEVKHGTVIPTGLIREHFVMKRKQFLGW